MIYRVGMRVKRVITGPGPSNNKWLTPRIPVGAEGEVMRVDADGDCDVLFDHHGRQVCYAFTLAPAVDPAADAFVRRVTKPYNEPVVTKETA
jgi:hypothetical protein